MTTRAATIDGTEMRWEEHGTGEPMVLVHGIPASPALWGHVVPRLEGCRCLCWEMVGYGASIPKGEGHVADQLRKIEYGERLARELAAPLRLIADGKHFMREDFPEIVAEEIPALVAAT